MFEFTKVCKEYEKLSVPERTLLLTKKSVDILAKLRLLDLPGVDPVNTLAGFILGSIVADGRVNEQEYLLMYPTLLRVFGDDFDFESIKEAFRKDRDGRNAIKEYTQEMLSFLALADESLREDIIMLCLCAVTVDGKISPREQRYIKKLCEASAGKDK